jgi:adenylate kinase
MGSTLFYIVGYPGSGKTTALTNAIESRVLHTHIKPFKHVHYENGMLQIGAERAWYGGTDALPLNAQPHVLKWLSGAFDKTILAEGDRLANGKFS